MKVIATVICTTLCLTAWAKHHRKKPRQKNDIRSVNMHRTPCHGRCPEYTIEIRSDGTVIYTGQRFTDDTGSYTKNIGDRAQEIFNLLTTYHVDTCKNMYRSHFADLPGMNLLIRYKDSTKNIINTQFGPRYFKQIEAEIDSSCKKTGDAGWEKISTKK